MNVFFVLLAMVVVGVVLFVSYLASQQRKRDLAAFAAAWGFTWDDEDPFDIPHRCEAFAAIDRGRGRRAYNVFHGERSGRGVLCFDYRYTTQSGKSQTTHRLSAAWIELGLSFPFLLIRPESLIDKVGELVGLDDIDFESAEFSRKFFVKSEDRKFAYDVFHARAMEFMLAQPRLFSLEFRGRAVLVTDDKCWSPLVFEAALAQVEGLLGLLPEFLTRELREGTA